MILPQDVTTVIDILEAAGHEAWVVGGCVRDCLLGRTPKDYDIASSCPMDEVCSLFPHSVRTGEAYGTITVITPSMPIEVTCYRIESDYKDSRHPNIVSPAADIETDLSRRDFTINAMAWHPKHGLCDPFGGQTDLETHTVRAVGDPYTRFDEDALRIMRCIRFASELDFDIDIATLKAARLLAPVLRQISVERISSELMRILVGTQPELTSILIESGGLSHLGFLSLSQPELLSRIPPIAALRLTGLLWLCNDDINESPVFNVFHVRQFLGRLRLKKRTIYAVERLLSAMNRPLPADQVALKRMFNLIPPESFNGLLSLYSVLLGKDTAAISKLLKETAGQPWNRSMLDISGNELSALGIEGFRVGMVLSMLLDRVLYNPALNTHDNLLNLARNYISAQNLQDGN